MGDGGVSATGGDGVNKSHVLFDKFVQGTTFKGTLKAFQDLCDHLEVRPGEYRIFYHKLKSKLNYWKAKALWAKLDKRAFQKEYKKGRACANSKCVIIGAGPCGLRTAIELAFLGAKVVLLEKRDAFSRNNVLHLWPFTIQDLRGLGAKKFYGKFCAGIRQLQLILLKVALLLGIEIHVNVEFKSLIEPPEDQETERPRSTPGHTLSTNSSLMSSLEQMEGETRYQARFRRKEFRGKLAIAITANFINRNTSAEAKVEEISGVAFIFNQKFFQDLRESTGVDLENIVYYKDDTHYFVMTAKKRSLMEKGVILHDYADTERLLSRANVDQAALLSYACEAADFSTNHQLPTLDFAINHYGQPDVAMFDFTCMYASENAAMVRQRNGHALLTGLVGDSLLEPFWPMGTGIARGFLAAMDSGWMVKSWAQGKTPLEVLAERESIYRILPQTTPENISKNFSHYSVDPTTRYPNISLNFLKPSQVRHFCDTGEAREMCIEMENVINSSTPKLARNESIARSSKLLNWCQRQTEGYRNVNVTDLTMSWKSGLALDFVSLDERDQEKNNQLGFDVAEREFGISPCMTGKEMSSVVEPDKLSMVMYLSQFYEMFKDTVPPGDNHNMSPEEKAALISSTKSPISFLSKLEEKENQPEEVSRSGRNDRPSVPAVVIERKMESCASGNHNKVKVMATQLLAKFEENAPQPSGLKRQEQARPLNTDEEMPLYVLSIQERAKRLASQFEDKPAQPKVTIYHRKLIINLYTLHIFGSLALLVNLTFLRVDTRIIHVFPPKRKPSRFVMEQWLLARSQSPPGSPPSTSDSLRQRYVRLYTGGVSPLADQIANQLQSQEDPKLLPEKKDLGSLRKEFPVNIGGSDVCFFCRKRVYVMERLSAEGKFFHRSCFKCEYCNTTLRLSSYAFDVEDGKFYCKPHFCYRLSGYAQRKRPAPSPTPITAKENQAPQTPTATVDAPGRAMAAVSPSAELQPSGTPLPFLDALAAPCRLVRGVGVQLCDLRRTLSWTCHQVARNPLDSPFLCTYCIYLFCCFSINVNGLQEPSLAKRLRGTPERIELENYRLSLQKEEELEEVPEETLAEHNLSSVLDKGTDADDLGSSSSESDMEEEDEQEEQDAEEGEQHPLSPSDLGGVPWKEAIQQVLQPVDPTAIPGMPCEDDDLEAEADSPDMEPGTEMDQDDIPSDAEAEARLHQSERVDVLPEEDKRSESQRMPSSIEVFSASPTQNKDVVLSPLKPSPELESKISLLKSPGSRFFPDPFIPEEREPERTMPSYSPTAQSPLSPSPAPVQDPSSVPSPTAAASPVGVPASSPLGSLIKSPISSPVKPTMESPIRSPVKSPVVSPICSQPTPLPETCTPKSPVYPQRSICPLTGNPLSPICAQPLPCQEPSSPLLSDSPVRSQPIPGVTSTPMTKTDKVMPDLSKCEDSSTEETPSKKTDIIEEFWQKSAEIRKSLGLTPLDRTSKILEKSVVIYPALDSTPVKALDVPEEQKPAFTGRAVIRRLNITLEGQVITPISPKSNGSDKRDLSSSSGLGLNGSMATSQTANSDSFNTSDSTMLTPPSSPPPPVPSNQSPAMLRLQKHQVSWCNGTEKHPPENAKEPAKIKSPVPAPRTQLSPVPKPAPRKVISPQAETAPVVVMREKKKKPRPQEVRKSFVETVEEIPFADDVEESYDERTPETSMNRYYTPPTSKPNRDRPPLHLALAMENGKPNIPGNEAFKSQRATQFSPEAKEIAEERMKAREKSVKSQALKDAMTKQLNKMKESDTDKGAAPKVALGVTSQGKKSAGSPKTSAVKALESKKTETLPERFFSSNKSLDSSVASSDGSSSGKSKKRSSLFSPRKNKKEKKAKNDSSRLPGTDETPPKHKSLWKAVFSGYKKDKKKKDDKSCPSTPSSSSTTQDSGKKKASPTGKSSGMQKEAIKEEKLEKERRRELKERKRLKERQKEKEREKEVDREKERDDKESLYVPHALAFKRSYATKKTYTEEELNAKLTRKVQKAARRQAKQEELKRLHRAQIIQRQLEQVEEKQRQLEERGVAVEKALRGEAGMGKKDDPKLMQEWFKLVQEKNALTEKELNQEKQILNEMLEVVEQRDALVALLDEQRLREKEEDKDLESVMLSKGFNLNWA
ncbi:hypothetical protein F7725_022588 [Dissostichus mawsoni]|uniref:F-actin monooxygenase n=1 Tax=Dissostichus mawsoni TaxID=36200 RepID=A0A7J5YZB2_DISMA|nr:hypothetical protein F7725_022588 [Dissostichus mawsoni]